MTLVVPTRLQEALQHSLCLPSFLIELIDCRWTSSNKFHRLVSRLTVVDQTSPCCMHFHTLLQFTCLVSSVYSMAYGLQMPSIASELHMCGPKTVLQRLHHNGTQHWQHQWASTSHILHALLR